MRLAFLGTPDFAVPALDALVAAGHEVTCVYAQPPARAGRGKAVRPSPVESAADRLGLPVETPARFWDVEADLARLAPDAAVVVAYGQILREAALAAPRLGCWNIHASLLPRWRGAAPIQRAIMAGDRETGVSIMRMERGLDTGPVLIAEALAIAPDETAGTVHDRLAAMGARLIVEALPRIAAGEEPVAQPDAGVTYAEKIEKAEARIDWTRPAPELADLIRGLSPFPGAWFEHAGTRVKALMAVEEAGSGPPGTALDDRLLIAAGQGAVRLTGLQRAGRGPLAAGDFLRGTPMPAGTRLS